MIFSEKINYAFGEQLGLNWYICRNDVHCNDLLELESVLRFLADLRKSGCFIDRFR